MSPTPTAPLLALLTACGSALAQTNFPEVEPNDRKGLAYAVNGLSPGDTITGFTSGTSTSTAGDTSADYFLVRAAPMPLNIYRNRLISSNTFNFPTTIRGLTTTSCFPNFNTDTALQNATSLSSPPRMIQWYGFGREERFYFRVTGSAGTAAIPYGWTMTREVVTPINTEGMGRLLPGFVTLQAAPGNTTDLDLAIYDEQLTPFTGFSNGGSNTLTRQLTAGVYYLAVSRRSFANDQVCPNDDPNRTAGAMDFPNILVAFSNIAPTDVSMRLTDGTTTIDLPASAPGAFDIMWIRFVVRPLCGTSDFNGDGDFGTDADIEAFFACLAGNCCATCWPGGSDFNGDGDSGTDADIESFFRVLAGNSC